MIYIPRRLIKGVGIATKRSRGVPLVALLALLPLLTFTHMLSHPRALWLLPSHSGSFGRSLWPWPSPSLALPSSRLPAGATDTTTNLLTPFTPIWDFPLDDDHNYWSYPLRLSAPTMHPSLSAMPSSLFMVLSLPVLPDRRLTRPLL